MLIKRLKEIRRMTEALEIESMHQSLLKLRAIGKRRKKKANRDIFIEILRGLSVHSKNKN